MLDEKNFRKLMILISLIVSISVIASYFFYYKSQPILNDDNIQTKDINQDMVILPFDAFSMLKEDLIIKFGQGEEGSGEDYDNQYIDYEQKWFGKIFKARYYYGLYTRIYQINLTVNKNDEKSVYDEMKRQLGIAIQDNFLDESLERSDKKTYWIKDSVRYSIFYEDSGQCMVKMWLEYYSNPDGHNLGQRPTIIQVQNSVDNIIDSQKVKILLIGDKSKYTSRYYKNLYLVIGTSNGSYVGRIPSEYDGGFYPKFSIVDIDGVKTILVEADNEYLKWYIGFEFKDNKLNVVYSSEKNPIQK